MGHSFSYYCFITSLSEAYARRRYFLALPTSTNSMLNYFYLKSAISPQIDRTGRIPMLRFRDRESYAGNKTKEYDDIAMKYLTYVLFLLAAGFAAYSLMYERHKSWYSWILSSLTSCVYMFGKLPSKLVRLSVF